MAGTRAEARSRLAAARRFAVAEGYGGHGTVGLTEGAVVLTLSRPLEEREAATEYTASLERLADDWDEDTGPLWKGWAVHGAFLAGIDWARRQ